jgi:predicted negative regulator of RcsB-dependent stress response
MARRVFRILLILVLAALAGVTGWQVWSLDRTRTQQREAAALLDRDALRVTQAILDLCASQRAYL